MTLDLRYLTRKIVSALMLGACAASAAALVFVLVAVVWHLLKMGVGAVDLAFFTRVPTGDAAAPGGMGHAVLGTVVLLALASLVGVPIGLLAGVYLSEYRSERALPSVVRFVADVIAGVPSIVVGILGYELLVVPLGSYNGFAGAFALAFLMVPIVARTTEEMLQLVPEVLREGALALGATKAATIVRVVLPSALGGVVTGVTLALARVGGETAPLLFTALGSRLLTVDPSRPFPSLTVQIFSYATGPYPAQHALAWAGMLVLVALLFIVNAALRIATRRISSLR